MRAGIKAMREQGALQLSLFDERDLAEVTAEFPGERLVVCRNPLLAGERTQAQELLPHRSRARYDHQVGDASAIRCAVPIRSGWPSAPC